MHIRNLILDEFEQHSAVIKKIDEQIYESLEKAVSLMVETLNNDGAVYVMGNGGSAADAQHFVAEMVGRFLMERAPLRFFALTTNTSILTAIGNDYSFDRVLARQVEAAVRPNDIIIGISTSGNSSNVISAFEAGKSKGCKLIGLTGQSGGKMASLCDVVIGVPSDSTPRIQETHILYIHILSMILEQQLFAANK
jgi:D-sedoheptulose 7-phosphate isomerase